MTEQRTEYEYGRRNSQGEHWNDSPVDVQKWAGWMYAEGWTPIRRTVMYGPVEVVPEPAPPFPTTPGSVILARINGCDVGKTGLFALTGKGWHRAKSGVVYGPEELVLIEVKYDAGKEADAVLGLIKNGGAK